MRSYRLLSRLLSLFLVLALAVSGLPSLSYAVEVAEGVPDEPDVSLAMGQEADSPDAGEVSEPGRSADGDDEFENASAPGRGGNGTQDLDVQDDVHALVVEDTQGAQSDSVWDEDAQDTDVNALGVDAEEEGDPVLALEDEATGDGVQTLPTVSVLTCMQSRGWAKGWFADGSTAGLAGKGKCLEAFRLRLANAGETGGTIQARVYMQAYGWRDWVDGGGVVGVAGKRKRIEAVQIKLKGDLGQKYDVWYRVCAQSLGWMSWTRNGETTGSVGKDKRIEALQVVITERDGSAPDASGQRTKSAFVGEEAVRVRAHVQGRGWLKSVANGKVAGTTGKGKRLEAIKVSLAGTKVPGSVEYRVYVQKSGWTKWVSKGKVAGTTGKRRRVEAVQMRLRGEVADAYDLYYRAYIQGVGWLSWATADGLSGSKGLARRVEAIQARLVPKGQAGPSASGSRYPKSFVEHMSVGYATYIQNRDWQAEATGGKTSGTTGKSLRAEGFRAHLAGGTVVGGITYRVRMQGSDWGGWKSNGAVAGRPGAAKRMEALQIKLAGTAGGLYNVWYRVHVPGFGWMGWTSNGKSAGTEKWGKYIDAVQVTLRSKEKSAPGKTAGAFRKYGMKENLLRASGARAIKGFGGASLSKGVIKSLKNAVNGIRKRGYDLGFVMMDLSSCKGITYNCDRLFYGASAIKAPYIASVVSQNPSILTRNRAAVLAVLRQSSNVDYKNLVAAYGKGPMQRWCRESGARSSIGNSVPWVSMSARDLGLLWVRTYQLFSASSAGKKFGSWCQNPNVSTIHATLGRKYRTRTKGGWIANGGWYNATNDGGIVYARNGRYVIAIMSNIPANHAMLNGLVSAIDAAHSKM